MGTNDPVDGLSLVIATNLRARRGALKLRQADVATKAGCSRAMISSIENERRRVTLDDAVALCRGLGVSLPDLLEGASPADRQILGI